MEVSIYSACHKKPKKYFGYHRGAIKFIEVGAVFRNNHFLKLKDSTGFSISNRNNSYNELTALYWAFKNDYKSEILGLCHYRRFFIKHPNNNYGFFYFKWLSKRRIKHILNNYQIIVEKKEMFEITNLERIQNGIAGIREQDINPVRGILMNCGGPVYAKSLDLFLRSKSGNFRNMFICKKDLFEKYCNWLFEVLKRFDDIIDYDKLIGFEKRIHGFWGEVLLNVYIVANNITTYEADVIYTDSPCYFSKSIKNDIKTLFKRFV